MNLYFGDGLLKLPPLPQSTGLPGQRQPSDVRGDASFSVIFRIWTSCPASALDGPTRTITAFVHAAAR